MSEKWIEVPNSVLMLAQELVREYHPDLKEARIGFIFRETVSYSKGMPVLGHAQKTSEMMKVYLDFDFIIWIAADAYADLDENQRKALIDHELCHCTMVDGVASLVGHDIEEFQDIIKRHGLWNTGLIRTAQVMKQMALDLGSHIVQEGIISSVPVKEFPGLEEAINTGK